MTSNLPLLLLCLCLLTLPLTACAPKPVESTPQSTPSPVMTTPTPPSPEVSVPRGIDAQLSPEEIERIKNAWTFDAEWAMTMPWSEGNGAPWHVGLGNAYEATLGLPYDGIYSISEPAQDLVALSFGTVKHRYYDGFSLMLFSDFYGDPPGEPEYCITYYISTTQPDCETPRGIHPGNTLAELKEVYAENKTIHIACTGTMVTDGYAEPYKTAHFELDCWLPIITSAKDWKKLGL